MSDAVGGEDPWDPVRGWDPGFEAKMRRAAADAEGRAAELVTAMLSIKYPADAAAATVDGVGEVAEFTPDYELPVALINDLVRGADPDTVLLTVLRLLRWCGSLLLMVAADDGVDVREWWQGFLAEVRGQP